MEGWLLQSGHEILQPKATLVEVLNGLLQRKKISINDRNEIEAITDSQKKLNIML